MGRYAVYQLLLVTLLLILCTQVPPGYAAAQSIKAARGFLPKKRYCRLRLFSDVSAMEQGSSAIMWDPHNLLKKTNLTIRQSSIHGKSACTAQQVDPPLRVINAAVSMQQYLEDSCNPHNLVQLSKMVGKSPKISLFPRPSWGGDTFLCGAYIHRNVCMLLPSHFILRAQHTLKQCGPHIPHSTHPSSEAEGVRHGLAVTPAHTALG